MNTVTYEEFLEFDPCWLKYVDGAERIKAYFDRFGGRMSALDILNLDDVSAVDRLWSVLREEFMPAPTLHEFACVCAECALSLIENPDPRNVKAIEVKRAWMRGEATAGELAAAWEAAYDAAWDAASDAAYDAAWAASDAAWEAASDAAWAAASDAAYDDAWDADYEVGDACDSARDAARAAKQDARDAQVAYLIMALEEEEVRGNG